MLAYTIRRLLLMIPVLLGISIMVFAISASNPNGGELYSFIGNPKNVTQSQLKALEHRLGLDKPLPVRYVLWLGSILHGDLGISYLTHEPATEAIGSRVPATLILMVTAFLLQEIIAIPLGIFSALRRGTLFDQTFSVIVYTLYSIPTFWLGLMLIAFLGVELRLFPFPGMVDVLKTGGDFGTAAWSEYFHAHPFEALTDLGAHLVMPAVTLAAVGIAGDSRYMRGQMLEVLSQDYVRTAKAKGLPQRIVIWKHALRNAVLPIITNIGLQLPGLIGGAVVTEQIFAWPGTGRLFISSAQSFDYAVVIGLTMIISALTLLFNLLTDLSYALVDPRIRYS